MHPVYYEHTKFINDIDGESRQIWKCIGTPINGPVVACVEPVRGPQR